MEPSLSALSDTKSQSSVRPTIASREGQLNTNSEQSD